MTHFRSILQILLLQFLLFSLSAAPPSYESGNAENDTELSLEDSSIENQGSIDATKSNQSNLRTRQQNLRIQEGEADAESSNDSENQNVRFEQEQLHELQQEEANSISGKQEERRLEPERARDLRFYTINLQFNRVIRPLRPNTNRRYVSNNIFAGNQQGTSFFNGQSQSGFPVANNQANQESIYFVGPENNQREPFNLNLGSGSSQFTSPRTPYTANALIIPDPTRKPTMPPVPTFEPTPSPTSRPTTAPPTRNPTNSPTPRPTKNPTRQPTKRPSKKPTKKPTRRPTREPTARPSKRPTRKPTPNPTSR
mmetsp:Transcript_22542/g.55863  ORF Transcript_22542/g.55863 Transcript_22542/m.55863 type:complete len:311 (+) Transcript_22542:137-1069(+)